MIFLLISFNLIAQTPFTETISTKLSKDWCDCIGSDTSKQNLSSCRNNILDKNKEYILDLKLKSENFADTNGYEFGKNLYSETRKKLINNCNTYYLYLLELERKKFERKFIRNANEIMESLAKINSRSNRDAGFYCLRAEDYFSLRDFKRLISDLDSAQIINSGYGLQYFIRAEFFEYINDYDNSIYFYKSSSLKLKLDFGEKIALLERMKKQKTKL